MANIKLFSVLVAATVLGLGACGGGGGGDDSGDDGMGGSGYGGTGGGGGGGGGSSGTTCPEIVDCFDACTTDACAQACIDAGSADAQDLINDVLACVAQFDCSDTACIEAHCTPQVNACYADSGGGGTGGGGGGGGGGPTGDPLPPSVVGTWGTAEGQAMIVYSFTADGHVSYSAGLQTGYGSCNSKSVWVYDGVVHVTGTSTITLEPTSGTYTTYDCSGAEISSEPYTDGERDQVATGTDAEGAVLQLTDLDTGNVLTLHRQ